MGVQMPPNIDPGILVVSYSIIYDIYICIYISVFRIHLFPKKMSHGLHCSGKALDFHGSGVTPQKKVSYGSEVHGRIHIQV